MRAVIRAAADATVTEVRGDINTGEMLLLHAGVTQSPQRGPIKSVRSL